MNFKSVNNRKAIGTQLYSIMITFITILLLPVFISYAEVLVAQSTNNVMDFNAKGDGKTYDTKAIQQAIDVCHEAGGGAVYFPPGYYLTGTLILKSFVSLHLETGATILGSQNMEDFKRPYLIYVKNAQHIGITGFGTIDGQGEVYWRNKTRPYNRPAVMIAFENSQNILIQGVTIRNAPHWTVKVSGCEYVNINGITMINYYEAPNTDGIDIMASANVFINNCYIQGGDDCICLKNLSKEKPTENITVTNCVIKSQDAAIKCGTESVGDIKNCVFNNIVIRNSHDGIALYMKDGGLYEYIHFSNITIESDDIHKAIARGSGCPIFIDIDQRTDSSKVGAIRNIVFDNISINTGIDNCLIQGRPDRPIENLTLSDVRMRIHSSVDHSTRKKSRGNRNIGESLIDYAYVPSHFTFAHINGLTIRNLKIKDDTKILSRERHTISLVDAQNITLEGLGGIQTIQDGKLSTIYIKDSKDVLIYGSKAIKGNGSFLRLEGNNIGNVSVIGNDLSNSSKAFDFDKNLFDKLFFQTANRLP